MTKIKQYDIGKSVSSLDLSFPTYEMISKYLLSS